MSLVTCKHCRWVSYAVTREDAEREVARFNAYYEQQPKEIQADFGGPSTLARYRCLVCGGAEFKPFMDGDCPGGCTVAPVIA